MKKLNKNTRSNIVTYGIVIIAFIICQCLMEYGPFNIFGAEIKMTRSLKGQLVPICVYIVMAISLNLVVGISGELSLGHAGFMSVGAFSGIVASEWMAARFHMDNETVRLILSMIIGGVFAGLAGVVIGIPVLRLRGDYLAIVTLAFGEIIRNVMNCLYISLTPGTVEYVASATNPEVYTKTYALDHLHFAFNTPAQSGWDVLINGPAGATGVDKIATFTMGFVLIIFSLIVVLNLINSRSGRAIMAIRDNRIAAESMGVNVTKYKMMAFVTSAALAGMAGALYGLNYSTVVASKFRFDTSILVLVFVVLGGIGDIRGSIIAAALLTVLPEMLRAFSDYRMLVYAIVLIVVMLASNNPTLLSIWNRIVHPRRKARAKAVKGGKAQ